MSMNHHKNRLTLIYSVLHGFFWCSYAISWSFTAIYLRYCGYSNAVVGLVTGIGAVLSVLVQPFMAALVRRYANMCTKYNIILFKLVSIISALFIMMHFPGMTTAILFLSLTAIDASIPSMLSSLAMESINHGKFINYGLARGVGSISYAAFALVIGYVVLVLSEGSLMYFYIIMSVLTIFVTLIMPNDKNTGSIQKHHTLGSYPFLIPFLIAAVFLFMGHNMLNVFLLNIIERAGGHSQNLGITQAISASVELPVMGLFVTLTKRCKTERLLKISAVFFAIKSFLTIFATSIWSVYLVYLLQFGSFALYTPASVYFINQEMNAKDSGIGQALLGACSLGLGGALGNVLGGFILDCIGVNGMLITAAVLSLCGILFMWISMAKQDRKQAE